MQPYKIFKRNFKKKNIQDVWKNSIRNKPSVGIDGININVFDKKLEEEIGIIYRKVLSNSYDFSFYKEKLISKGKKKYPRVLSIPTIRDKIVLKIIFNTLAEVYQDDLSNELIHTKIDRIKTSVKSGQYNHYIKIDIENFYPSIDHEILLKQIRKKVRKKEFINLVKKAVTQETVSKSNQGIPKYSNEIGVPQGLSISNLLASIYFIEIDNKYSNQLEFDYYRYVDDILILCDKKDVKKIFKFLKDDMRKLNLTIHEEGKSSEKTDSGSIKKGFYFLGYLYSKKLISVRESSINNLHNSIVDIFTQYKHSEKKNEKLLYWKLNLKITGCKYKDKKYGWLYFFSQINDETLLFKLDVYVKKMFGKFNVTYDKPKVKRFVRTHFEILKNRTNSNYIPNFTELSVEEKKQILYDTFDIELYDPKRIEEVFDSIINKSIREMEKDIQMY